MPARHRDRTDRSIGPIGRLRSDVSDRTDRDATPIHFYRSRLVRIDLKIFPRERTNANVKIEKNPPRHMSDCSYRGSRDRDRDIADGRASRFGCFASQDRSSMARVRDFFVRIDPSDPSVRLRRVRSGSGSGRACAYSSAWIFFTARAPVESRAESARRSIWREKAFEHSGRP